MQERDFFFGYKAEKSSWVIYRPEERTVEIYDFRYGKYSLRAIKSVFSVSSLLSLFHFAFWSHPLLLQTGDLQDWQGMSLQIGSA